MPGRPQSICLYCGSRTGRDPVHRAAAEALGRALGESGRAVIYGAGDIGLMGIAASAAQAAGAQVTGFIPRHLHDREVGKRDIHALVVTETMHERKKLMFFNCDAVIALPGGAGTLDELVEVLTWRQLGLHQKPIIILDIAGFWQPFLDLIDHMIAQGFIDPGFLEFFRVAETVEDALAALA